MHKLTITNKDINIDECIYTTNKEIKEYIKYIKKITNIEWKIIPDYSNYIISEYGDIINVKFKRTLKPSLNTYGYYKIILYKNNICKTFKIHRLVYSIFIDNDIKDYDIHHKDENKLNNHYSNLQKMTKSNHTKGHCNLESEEYLKRYKMYYDLKYKDHLSTKEIAKKYNVTEDVINYGIKQYKIYLSLDKDIDKYNSLSEKERDDYYTNTILKEKLRIYLEKAEIIYNRKKKENLTYEELSKIYNISKYIIKSMSKDIEIFTFLLNRDFDKFYNLSKKEKKNLQKEVTTLKRNNRILSLGKQIKDLILSKLSFKDIAKKLELSKSRIIEVYKRYNKLLEDEEIRKELKIKKL